MSASVKFSYILTQDTFITYNFGRSLQWGFSISEHKATQHTRHRFQSHTVMLIQPATHTHTAKPDVIWWVEAWMMEQTDWWNSGALPSIVPIPSMMALIDCNAATHCHMLWRLTWFGTFDSIWKCVWLIACILTFWCYCIRSSKQLHYTTKKLGHWQNMSITHQFTLLVDIGVKSHRTDFQVKLWDYHQQCFNVGWPVFPPTCFGKNVCEQAASASLNTTCQLYFHKNQPTTAWVLLLTQQNNQHQ